MNTISGEDLSKKLEAVKFENELNKQRLQAAVAENKKKAALLQEYIVDNANPDPYVLIGLTCFVIVSIYLIYICVMKKLVNGYWYAEDGTVWKIKHDPFTDKIHVNYITINGEFIKGTGFMKNDTMHFNGAMGIYNGTNTIVFSDGNGIKRLNF
jgi:hypothetical protein